MNPLPRSFITLMKLSSSFPIRGCCIGRRQPPPSPRPQDRVHHSHMPCRLASSSASLAVAISPLTSMCRTSKKLALAPRRRPVPRRSSPSPFLSHRPPLSSPIVNFADEIKQTNFRGCVRGGALDRVSERENQCGPQCEIKLNM